MINEMKPFEPQKINRFLIEFNSPFNIPTYVIHKMSELRAKQIDGEGNIFWDELTFTLFDVEQFPVASIIYKGITETKSNRVSLELIELNIVGETIQTWKINAKLKNISFGERDWSNYENRKIEINLWDVNVKDIK
jgi:hypothetical protein